MWQFATQTVVQICGDISGAYLKPPEFLDGMRRLSPKIITRVSFVKGKRDFSLINKLLKNFDFSKALLRLSWLLVVRGQ